jgi:hypothetical protein
MSAFQVTYKAESRVVQVLGKPEQHRQNPTENKIKQQKLPAKVKVF